MSKSTTGIRARHARACKTSTDREARCSCQPSYEAWVFSRRDGKKIRKTFSGAGALSAAKSWRSDAGGAVRKGTMSAPTRQTLEQAAEAWLEGAKAHAILTRSGQPFKPSVIRGYEADLRRYVFDDLGAHKLAEIRRADLQWLVDKLVKEKKSASKIHNVLMPVRSVCRYAIERDEILVNPTTNLRLPIANGKRERVADPAEVAELLEALPEEQRPLWATAAFAGLRMGELRGLKWSDVDLAANTITVARGWDAKEGAIDPKSKKGKRRVPIVASLRRYLLEHKLRTGRDGDAFVFGRSATSVFTQTHVRKQALAAWAAANVKREEEELALLSPITLHELRHSFVSMMHAAGFSLEQIGDYVGHSSAYMTDAYRHLLDGHEADAAKRFEKYLADATGASSGAQGG